jgi:hypothetical protein
MLASWALGGILVACGSVAGYHGDGQLIDNGSSAATDRYILDLGPVSLAKKSAAHFRIAGLPSEVFVVGLQLASENGARQRLDTSATSAEVSIQITDQQSNVVVRIAGPLPTWTWSASTGGNEAFVYGGYGANASFRPEAKKGPYMVKIAVLEPDPRAQDINARLLLKAGGWK